jgi:hypothetical protein
MGVDPVYATLQEVKEELQEEEMKWFASWRSCVLSWFKWKPSPLCALVQERDGLKESLAEEQRRADRLAGELKGARETAAGWRARAIDFERRLEVVREAIKSKDDEDQDEEGVTNGN